MVNPPEKLKNAPIAEALFEIRFACNSVPELVVGALASRWKDFTAHRLPVAEIPASFRKVDPNLQHQPMMELRKPDTHRVVKVGEQMLSYHALAPYPGWLAWSPELLQVIDFVFGQFEGFVATRLGLRYINAFTTDHFVSNVGDLNLSVAIGDAPLDVPFNLNYQSQDETRSSALIRIASKEFVASPSPTRATAVVDVDVFTQSGFTTSDAATAKGWLKEAHDFEKREFFKLFDEELLRKLREN